MPEGGSSTVVAEDVLRAASRDTKEGSGGRANGVYPLKAEGSPGVGPDSASRGSETGLLEEDGSLRRVPGLILRRKLVDSLWRSSIGRFEPGEAQARVAFVGPEEKATAMKAEKAPGVKGRSVF
ncbi:hypothetical protein KM043_010630 [Ampulex compressa]|nr:hypothetical protein KM043_010630 [Ampulex compressa]